MQRGYKLENYNWSHSHVMLSMLVTAVTSILLIKREAGYFQSFLFLITGTLSNQGARRSYFANGQRLFLPSNQSDFYYENAFTY